MNLYLVVSEWIPGDWTEGDYKIAELVLAKSYSQARYLAWNNDPASKYDSIMDMPKFEIRLKWKDTGYPFPRIASDLFQGEEYWWFWTLDCEGKEEWNAFLNYIDVDRSSNYSVAVDAER